MKKPYVLLAAALLAIGLALALRVALFHASVTRIPAFDDECKIAIQSWQIRAGARPLLILASPYLFPLDAYLMAPLIPFLPRNAFGARIMAFGFGLLTVAFTLLVLRRMGRWRDVWPGALLVLLPSAYLLTLQAGVALPGYPPLMLCAALVLWLAARQAERPGRAWAPALAAGVIAGLACSDTLLALSVLLAGGAMLALHRGWRTARWAAPCFALGALAGFLPHLVARLLNRQAFEAVSQSVSLAEALRKLWSPALRYTLPSAFGLACPIFPDHRERVGWFAGWETGVSAAWLAVLAAATVLAVADAIPRWRRERWPSLSLGLVAVGISWLDLGLFAFANRAHFHTYRYFAPLVWCFPLVLASVYARARGPFRAALAALAVLWAAADVGAAGALMRRWREPGFADYLKCYDLRPTLRYLDERGIDRCYATYADAYRIIFETDGRIICSQPYNERFPAWRVPFKDEYTDPATRVAYVLSDTYRFPPELFERDLATMGVAFRRETCGRYQVYTDFQADAAVESAAPLPSAGLTAAASHNPARAAAILDGAPAYWRCDGYLQETGMWVSVTWPEPRRVRRLEMDYGDSRQDYPARVRVYTRVGGTWRVALPDTPARPAPFVFRNQHPVYGRTLTGIELPAGDALTGLKVEILEPRPRYAWTLAEVRLYE